MSRRRHKTTPGRSCAGKRRYADQRAAEHGRDHHIARGTAESSVATYPCARCGRWHVGDRPGSRGKR